MPLMASKKAHERAEFYRARENYDDGRDSVQSIATIMQLSVESACSHVRYMAARWLNRTLGVVVIPEEGSRHAAPSRAAAIR
jgi:hypothetical protein